MTIPQALIISPNFYWLLLLLASVLIGGLGISLFVLKTSQANQYQITLRDINDGLAEIKDRTMDNRDQISYLLRRSERRELIAAFDDLLSRAGTDYKNEWVPDPAPLAVAAKNTDSYRKLGGISFQAPSLAGLIATILLIVCQNFLTGSNPLMLASSLFPFLLGLSLTYLIQSAVKADRENIDFRIERLLERLKLILPVYSDEAASALLVERFVTYNQNLSESAKDLVASEVIAGVSQNLEELLERDVVPSLTRSSQTISDLARDLAGQQDNKMAELASSFSEQLTTQLNTLFEPVNKQLLTYVSMMEENQERVNESLRDFTMHRESLDLVSKDVSTSLECLRVERDGWQAERQALNEVLAQITEAGSKLIDLQNSAAETLADRLDALGINLDSFAESTASSLKQLADINSRLDDLLRDTNLENSKTVQDYRILSSEIMAAAKNMEQTNMVLASSVNELNTALADSVGGFRHQIQTQVNSTLEDFDRGLAEMSLRLSHSVTEIRDTVNSMNRLTDDSRARDRLSLQHKAEN